MTRTAIDPSKIVIGQTRIRDQDGFVGTIQYVGKEIVGCGCCGLCFFLFPKQKMQMIYIYIFFSILILNNFKSLKWDG